MSVVKFEVVELVDDLLAGLARKELGVLDHRGVDFLETKAFGGVSKVVEQPISAPHLIGVEITRAPRGLEALFGVALAHLFSFLK